ncbi:MAG TPA: HD domain-containing phosphohydrolase [Candidatus Dormibacteraeota bacterium]|jgi:putative nucleotidyltransferase with HDIG domain|nr:HD domain-containing phosphohydrolase [Candidatus Dormibacteraeota bacterium]
MRLDFTYLHSRLARRIFWLFVVCALLPISVLALVSLISVSKEMKQESYRRLSQAGHDEGMIIFERILLLDENLRILSTDTANVIPNRQSASFANTDSHFSSLALLSADGGTKVLSGRKIEPIQLSAQEQMFLNSGKTLLSARKCSDSATCIYLIRELGKGQAGRQYILGEVQPSFLWSSDDLSESMDLCVFGQSDQILYCSRSAPNFTAERSSDRFNWKEGDLTYVGHYWKLPMKTRFMEDHWTIAAIEEENASLSALGHFRRSFLLVILLAMWVVLFLSLIQIRRTLVPLEQLREGTRKIARGELETRVAVASNDEFQELGTSFNLMSAQIESHVRSLKTLNEIDRAILSSWDLDHIVEALFSRLPDLLSYEVAGITVIGSDEQRKTNAYIASSGGDLRFVDAITTDQDIDALKQNPESFVVGPGDLYPQYLLPLVSQGMRYLLVLPVLVDGKPSAVLAFGHAAAREWSHEDTQQARRVADQVAVAFSNAGLISQLKQLRWGTLTALARAIDAKSPWTAGHSERVTMTAIKIGREMGLSGKEIDILHAGGLLHDVGKIGVPVELLDKPGALTPEERLQIQEHVLIGVRILKPIPGFEEFLPIVREHHEWFNGKGYPYGIAGENISLHGRIFAVADVHDALISDRPYRKGMPLDRVVAILRGGSGTQFDPQIVDAFFRVMQKEDVDVSPASIPETVLAGQEK